MKRHELCNQIETWIAELSKPQYNERCARTISVNLMVLRRQYRQLREELAKLPIPVGLEDLDLPFNSHVTSVAANSGLPPLPTSTSSTTTSSSTSAATTVTPPTSNTTTLATSPFSQTDDSEEKSAVDDTSMQSSNFDVNTSSVDGNNDDDGDDDDASNMQIDSSESLALALITEFL